MQRVCYRNSLVFVSSIYKGEVTQSTLHSPITFNRIQAPARKRYCHSGSAMNLFSSAEHAKLYSKYRPTYPNSLHETIVKFCKASAGNKLRTALDVGCGNGQSCVPLKQYFENVIGLDPSQSQIDQARKAHEDIQFVVGPGEDLSFIDDKTVDLVTSAQSLHWIDTNIFYPEVVRFFLAKLISSRTKNENKTAEVLRPGGALVVFGYGNCVLDNPEARKLVWQFYRETLNGHWDDRRGHIDNHYADMFLPFSGWKRNDDLVITKKWTVDAFIGYLSSWSGWRHYLETNPGSGVLDELRQKILSLYKAENDNNKETMVIVEWPIFMLLGRKDEES